MKTADPSISLLWVLSSLGLAGALFVPEELPTLLSFLYTNIPPVFKGTDSRLGVGFRVGQNADVQVQLELGPQTRTQSLEPDAEGSSKKRHVIKQYHPAMNQNSLKAIKFSETPQGWLQNWKASAGTFSEDGIENDLNVQPVVDYDTLRHLQQLYREQSVPEDDMR